MANPEREYPYFVFDLAREYIKNDELQEAINKLLEYDQILAVTNARNSLLQQSGRLRQLASTDTRQDQVVESNQIRIALLKQIDEMEKEENYGDAEQAGLSLRNIVFGLKISFSPYTREKFFVRELELILAEIEKTYLAIEKSIIRFEQPAYEQRLNAEAYLQFKNGSLSELIEENRGRSSKIRALYNPETGEGFKSKLQKEIKNPGTFKYIDSLFWDLLDADTTVFKKMAYLGSVFKFESANILALLRAKEEQKAREKIAEVADRLVGFKENLSTALREIKDLKENSILQ